MLHASGRYDRSVEDRRNTTRAQRRYNALITRTEQSRKVLLRTLVWAVLRFPGPHAKGDVTIEHHRRRWARLDGYALLLSDILYLEGRKRNWGVVGIYQKRRLQSLRIIIAVHMPARVQGDLRRGKDTAETKAWTESLRTLGDEVNRLKKKHPGARIDVVGDWNVAVEDAYYRNLISMELGLTPMRPVDIAGNRLRWKDLPGTHGSRTIDWGWSTDEEATCSVKGLNPASDHHPIHIV